MPEELLTCSNCCHATRDIVESDISGLPTTVKYGCTVNHKTVEDPETILCLDHDRMPSHSFSVERLEILRESLEAPILDWLTHTEPLETVIQELCNTLGSTINTYILECFETHSAQSDRRMKVYTENMTAIMLRTFYRRMKEEEEADREEDVDVEEEDEEGHP